MCTLSTSDVDINYFVYHINKHIIIILRKLEFIKINSNKILIGFKFFVNSTKKF